MASCAKVLLSECVTIGLQLRKHATRCSQVVVWLVWMGLMSASQNDVRNSEKMNTFLGIFAGVNGCSFVQNLYLLRLDLAILWLKVAKNYGVAKIRVFLHPDMLKFWSVDELSCWGCELEIECQTAYPSATGKV